MNPNYIEPKVTEWRGGPPPGLGWWPCKLFADPDNIDPGLGMILRFWNGSYWSFPCGMASDKNHAGLIGLSKAMRPMFWIQWTDRWWMNQHTRHQFHDREDGLLHCMVCHGAEGSLPTECPRRAMSEPEQDAVQRGWDYKDGNWHQPKPKPAAEKYVHQKSGGVYTFIGMGLLQTDKPMKDLAGLTMYRGIDGRYWARDADEFAERFKKIS